VQIVILGVNHGSAPVEIRERLAIPENELPDALRELHELVAECYLLSTCNRTEVYAFCGHESTGADLLRRWMGAQSGLTAAQIEQYSYVHGHSAAVRHAFRVAAGLDSMIVGEDQILGQVRRALGAARTAGTLGPVLDRLGSSALACGKRARNVTALNQRPASVVSVALDAASRELEPLAGARTVVIGSGRTASLALSHLLRTAPARVTVVNRSPERAAALSLVHGVEAAPWQALPELLADADMVVSCTAAPRPVLTAELLREARKAPFAPKLVCVDLGVPRDIEAQARGVSGVLVVDLDALGTDALEIRSQRQRQVEAAEELVLDEVERFMSWWRERDVAPVITLLHERLQRIRSAELDRAISRLPDLSPSDREVMRALTVRITSKLLHELTIALKRDPEGSNMAVMLDRMLHLSEAGLAAPDDGPPAGVHARFPNSLDLTA
jgi:glutamyl-tRNA reductase